MSGTDHPPSTTGPTRVPRRALLGVAAASAAAALLLAILAGPWGGPGSASAAEPPAGRLRPQSEADAILTRVEGLAEAVAPRPTAPPTSVAPVTTEAPPPPPAPVPQPAVVQPVVGGGGYNDPYNPAAWDRLAVCESSGNWAANTGNGYYGGIQFSLASWQAVGGVGRPDLASRDTQIAMGQRLWAQGGWGHWPGCTAKLGYR